METVSKMKYSRTDRLVLGIGYAILGLFVLSIVVPLVYSHRVVAIASSF